MSPRHPEVAEPQPNRSMQDLNCHPELVSGSSHCGDEGSPLTPTLSRRARGKRAAFTLAEVLITLAIIGVVAAMTIPTLISNYQEKVTVTKLKKMYSVLSQAYRLYRVENGVPGHQEKSADGAKAVFDIFKPYLRITNDCGTDGVSCIGQTTYLTKDGNRTSEYSSHENYYKVVLNDSSTIWFRGGSDENSPEGVEYDFDIMFDVNGAVGPNRWGHDLFEFYVLKGELYPNGTQGKPVDNDCLTSDGYGYGCAAWVIQKGNLDYLKCPDELTWSDNKCD